MSMSASPEARLAERRRSNPESNRQAALFAALQMHSEINTEDAHVSDVIETAVAFLGFLESGEASEVR